MWFSERAFMVESKLVALLVLGVFMCAASAARADSLIQIPIADGGSFSGSRSTADGLEVTSTGAANSASWASVANGGGGFKIDFTVSRTGSVFTYSYGFTKESGAALQKAVSHVILQVSEAGGGLPAFSLSDLLSFSPGDGTPSVGNQGPGPSNPGIPGSLWGLKFDYDSQPNTLTFTTRRVPIWGSFYAKDGKTAGVDNAAWNSGFTNTSTRPDPINGPSFSSWIPVPDTAVVPLPAAAWMGMSLLGGVGGVGFFRRRRLVEA
jgi:hypothetical protein